MTYSNYIDLFTYLDVILLPLIRLVVNPESTAPRDTLPSLPLPLPPRSVAPPSIQPNQAIDYVRYVTLLEASIHFLHPKANAMLENPSMTEEDQRLLQQMNEQVQSLEQEVKEKYNVHAYFEYLYQDILTYHETFSSVFHSTFLEYQTKIRALTPLQKERYDASFFMDYALSTFSAIDKNMQRTSHKFLETFQLIVQDKNSTFDDLMTCSWSVMSYYREMNNDLQNLLAENKFVDRCRATM
jgi:hypothetical protein